MHIKKRGESGQGLIEYILLIALIGVVLIGAMNLMGISLKDAFTAVAGLFDRDSAPAGGGDAGGDGSAAVNLFYDDFLDTAMNDWRSLKTSLFNDKVWVSDGSLHAGPLASATLKKFSGSDYVVTASGAQLTQTGKTYQGYGLWFRMSNEKAPNGYMVEIEKKNARDPGLIYISKWVNGYQITPPIASAPLPKDFDWNKPGDLQVVVEGNTFTASLGGVEMLTAADKTYTSGTVGIASNYGNSLSLDSFSVDAIK